jgi:protein SCO1/2
MNKLTQNVSLAVFFLLLLSSFLAESVKADNQLGVYEQLDQYLADDLIFTDEKFEKVNLREAIVMPTVIALVYYECPGICTPLMNGLADVMKKSDMVLNKDYQVFTISFSHFEKTVLAQNKKKTYEKLVGKGDTENGWRFFTGDSITIRRLLDNIGYQIKQEGADFIHPATLVVLSPDGKITRYLHGTYFLPFDLKMALVEAGLGRSGATINKVLKFCFSYDAEGKRYVFNVTKVSGSIILLLALSFLGYLIFSGNRNTKTPNI